MPRCLYALQEFLAIQNQQPRNLGFFGTRNMGFMHQQLIEVLAYAMLLTVSQLPPHTPARAGRGRQRLGTTAGSLAWGSEQPEQPVWCEWGQLTSLFGGQQAAGQGQPGPPASTGRPARLPHRCPLPGCAPRPAAPP